MARESAALKSIADQLRTMSGVKVYDQVMLDKWNTYQFPFIGVLSGADSREVIGLEDDSAFANKGTLDVFLLVGVQVKKNATAGKANLREALADLSEAIENKLTNFKPDVYESDYERTIFAPVHFIDSQAVTFNDDETKGISFMTFRTVYYRGEV
jgi:hypothetical protein